MQNVVDLIGSALASYYEGDKKSELIIKEDCRITSIPMADFFRHPNDSVRDRIALSYCRRNVLNLGASSGEHSLYLLSKGVQVTSMDSSPITCDLMKKRGLPSVVCGNIFNTKAQLEQKDTWLALKGVIGHLGNIRKFNQFLELAWRYIPSHGRVILSSSNLEHEGYRTRRLSFEFANRRSNSISWFDIGISTLNQIADQNDFDSRVIYCDESNKYIALLTKR